MVELTINCDDNPITFNKKNYLLSAAKRMGIKVHDYKDVVDGTSPNHVLNIEPFSIFHTGKKWTGIWEIDLLLDRSQTNTSNWAACDDVLLASSNTSHRLRGFGDRKIIMQQACDPVLHRRIPEIEQKYDFVFSGTIGLDVYIERERALKVMKKNFTFKDQGKNHKPKKYVKKINEARVQWIRSGCTNLGSSQVAQRFFECLAIGPVLKDYHPDLELTGLVEGADYLSYKNDEEMIDKMHMLLENPEIADQIAKNGRKKAVAFHSYENRLISILNLIKEHAEDDETLFSQI